MSKILIYTDSTSDLSVKIRKERNIEMFPLKVCFNEEIYFDQVDIDSKKLYTICAEKDMLPKTSSISIDEFENIFTKGVGQEGNDIIFMGISSKLSSSYNNALVALNNVDPEIKKHVYVIDTLNLTAGCGLLVLKACDLRDQGKTVQEIVKEITKLLPLVRAQFSVKDLIFLHKGGRCSGTSRFFGTMLRIRPILRLINGEIILDDKAFGKYEKALDLQIEDLVNNIDNIDKKYLFITHSEADEEAKYILETIPKNILNQFENVYETKASCVVSSHCGEHTIGILYLKTK